MTTPSTDWSAAQSGAAVFDLSDRGQVELTGPDAVAFLHNLCTNDIKNLAVGRGCEFFLTTNKARIIGHGFAHRLAEGLWLDVDPSSAAKVVAHLDHFIVSEQVEIADRSDAFGMLHLAGPLARVTLDKVIPGVPALDELQHHQAGTVRVVRHDRLGLPGFDLVCARNDKSALHECLTTAGAAPASADTFNILRVEAGVPTDGLDFDAERFVVEVGRIKQAISYTKGCYLGQEPIVMARDRGHVNRTLLGLKVDGAESLPPGTRILRAGEEVGQVTSSVWSPRLGAVIALAYLKRGSQAPGTAVDAGARPATVTALPFEPGVRP
jgi:folate-binding protein YgfZ